MRTPRTWPKNKAPLNENSIENKRENRVWVRQKTPGHGWKVNGKQWIGWAAL